MRDRDRHRYGGIGTTIRLQLPLCSERKAALLASGLLEAARYARVSDPIVSVKPHRSRSAWNRGSARNGSVFGSTGRKTRFASRVAYAFSSAANTPLRLRVRQGFAPSFERRADRPIIVAVNLFSRPA